MTAQLRDIATTDSRELDRACERIAEQLITSRSEPSFDVDSDDFQRDPYLICADRYWRLRFLAEPTITTAAHCARWLHRWVTLGHRAEITEKWALGYSFITRDTIESRDELSDATARIVEQSGGATDIVFFAALYHAGKLRADFAFDELRLFLESSMLALAAGGRRDDPIFIALQAFAAFGSRNTTREHSIELLDRAWNTPVRSRHVIDICLNALAAAVPVPEGQLLTERAAVAIDLYPRDHIFWFRLATGQRLTGHHQEALTSIDKALGLLPATGSRGSHKLLQEQYLRERDMIIEGQNRSAWAAEQEHTLRQSRAALAEFRRTAERTTIRSIELVSVFAAVIAFAFGSPQFIINGTMKLSDRLWLLTIFGLSLTIFAFVIIAGTWFLTRNTPPPDQSAKP